MKVIFKYLVLVMIATACSNKQVEKALDSNSAIKVTTETVRTVKGSSELRYSGTIEPSQTIPLTFQSSGIVSTVLVQAGDMVTKGQLLATVDRADNENMYKASLAKYTQAKDAYDRLKSVHDNGSLPEIKWVEMETNLTQAESQMQITKSSLDKCNMRAPENGLIGARNIEPGQSSLTTSSPLTLVKIENVFVKISVPENEIGKMYKGDKASFSVSALNGKTFSGAVTNISPVADAISRTYEAKITVQNSALELKPGMVCDVVLNTKSQKEVIVIPYQSVTKDMNGNTYVYVVDKSVKRVRKQLVQPGNYLGNRLEIISGINAGQTIVKEGKEKLSDNSLIKF